MAKVENPRKTEDNPQNYQRRKLKNGFTHVVIEEKKKQSKRKKK